MFKSLVNFVAVAAVAIAVPAYAQTAAPASALPAIRNVTLGRTVWLDTLAWPLWQTCLAIFVCDHERIFQCFHHDVAIALAFELYSSC